MMTRGREFLANHHLYRNRKNGGIIQDAWTKLSFPPRWHYDVLRALDFFQDAGFSPDERLDDVIGLIKQKRRKDGTWTLQNKHPGRVFFDLERQRSAEQDKHATRAESAGLVGQRPSGVMCNVFCECLLRAAKRRFRFR